LALTGGAELALFGGYERVLTGGLVVYLAFTFLINEMFGEDIFLLANHFALD
jgi:succinate-acetate transporter protein